MSVSFMTALLAFMGRGKFKKASLLISL